jgi:hypothetical protein
MQPEWFQETVPGISCKMCLNDVMLELNASGPEVL